MGDPRRKRIYQATALGLIGLGLLVLGLVALVMLPQMEATSRSSGNQGSNATGVIPAQVDYPAPTLNLTDLEGNPVSLQSLYGQVVLVNHWATWCPPCKAEMPDLQKFYEQYQARGFTIVAIEAGEPPDEVAQFAEQLGITFPVWVDPQTAALRAFRTNTLPSSFVLDRTGQVRLAWTGPIDLAGLVKYVAPMLEE